MKASRTVTASSPGRCRGSAMAERVGVEGTPGEMARAVLALLAGGGAEDQLAAHDVTEHARALCAAHLVRASPPGVHLCSAIVSVEPPRSIVAAAISLLCESSTSVDSLHALGSQLSEAVGVLCDRASVLGRAMRSAALSLCAFDAYKAGRLLDRICVELHCLGITEPTAVLPDEIDADTGAAASSIAMQMTPIEAAVDCLLSGEWKQYLTHSLTCEQAYNCNASSCDSFTAEEVDAKCNEAGPKQLSHWLETNARAVLEGRDLPGLRAEVERLARAAPSRNHANPELVQSALAAAAVSSLDATASIDAIHQRNDALAEVVQNAGTSWRPYNALLQRAELHALLGQAEDAQAYANEALKGTLQSPDEQEHLLCLAGICSSGLKVGRAPQEQSFVTLLSYLARRSAEQDLPHLLAYALACAVILKAMRGTLLLPPERSGSPSGEVHQYVRDILPRSLALLHTTGIRTAVPLAPADSAAASNSQQQQVRGPVAELTRNGLRLPTGPMHLSAQQSAFVACSDSTATLLMLRASYAALDTAEPVALANLLCFQRLGESPSCSVPACSWWKQLEGELSLATWKLASQGPTKAEAAAEASMERVPRRFLAKSALAIQARLECDVALRRSGFSAKARASNCMCAHRKAVSFSMIDSGTPQTASRLAAVHTQFGNSSAALRWHWEAIDRAQDSSGASSAVDSLIMQSTSESSLRHGPYGMLNALAARSFARNAGLAALEATAAAYAAEALLEWTSASFALARLLLEAYLQPIEAHCDICTAGRARLALAKCYLHEASPNSRHQSRRRSRQMLEQGAPLLERSEYASGAEEANYLLARIAHFDGEIHKRNMFASRWKHWAYTNACCRQT